MVKRRVPNVVRGGIAIPLKDKTNYYYMAGRKHKNGGIDIGENPRTGLEVEDGEVMHVSKDEIKVFSSVPFLNGKSPAQKVLDGENPNTVFKQQEAFKDRNGINDDGTKKNNRTKAKMGTIDWDKVDEYADTAEKTLGAANLGLSAATLVAPNPYTAAGAYTTGLAGIGTDIYQGIRSGIKKDWTGVGKNVVDIGLSLAGMRALKAAKKLDDLNKVKQAAGVPREYVTHTIGRRPKTIRKIKMTKEADAAEKAYTFGYISIPAGTALNFAGPIKPNNKNNTKNKKAMGGPVRNNKRYTTTLTVNEEKQFQNWYSKVAKHKNLNPNPDADGQDYDYRGYWKNEDRDDILGSNPNAHFPDKYKQPTHPTFSNGSIYSNDKTPGGTWVKGKGTWLFKHNKFTARQADRTADYLNGTGEGFILGTDTIIPNIKKRMGGLSRSKDYGSKSKPYPSVKSGDFAGGHRSYPIPTKADAIDALRLAGLHGRSDVRAKVYAKYPDLRKKSKSGGLYSVTVNGETKLKMFPSINKKTLSDINNRDKFILGGDDEYLRIGDTKYNKGSVIDYNGDKIAVIGKNKGIAIDGITGASDKQDNKHDNLPSKIHSNISPYLYFNKDLFNTPTFKPKSIRNNNEHPISYKKTSNNNEHPISYKKTSNNNNNEKLRNIVPIRMNPPRDINSIEDFSKPISKTPINRIPLLPIEYTDTDKNVLKPITIENKYQNNKTTTNNTIKEVVITPKNDEYETDMNITNNKPFESTTLKEVVVTPEDVKDNTENRIAKNEKRNRLINSYLSGYHGDAINLLNNIGGNIATTLINRRALNKMQAPPQPMSQTAAKLKTRININPQLDKMRETLAAYERDVDNNTASSRVALARKQRARFANMLQTNELYSTKENAETELINKDRLNQQEVANNNVKAYNAWQDKVNAFNNAITDKKAENLVGLTQGITSGITSTIGNIQQRIRDDKSILANALSHPNLPIEEFYHNGLISKRAYKAYRKAYPLKTDTNEED